MQQALVLQRQLDLDASPEHHTNSHTHNHADALHATGVYVFFVSPW